jgi:hypothetical protein
VREGDGRREREADSRQRMAVLLLGRKMEERPMLVHSVAH